MVAPLLYVPSFAFPTVGPDIESDKRLAINFKGNPELYFQLDDQVLQATPNINVLVDENGMSSTTRHDLYIPGVHEWFESVWFDVYRYIVIHFQYSNPLAPDAGTAIAYMPASAWVDDARGQVLFNLVTQADRQIRLNGLLLRRQTFSSTSTTNTEWLRSWYSASERPLASGHSFHWDSSDIPGSIWRESVSGNPRGNVVYDAFVGNGSAAATAGFEPVDNGDSFFNQGNQPGFDFIIRSYPSNFFEAFGIFAYKNKPASTPTIPSV